MMAGQMHLGLHASVDVFTMVLVLDVPVEGDCQAVVWASFLKNREWPLPMPHAGRHVLGSPVPFPHLEKWGTSLPTL